MREYGSEHPAVSLPDGYFNGFNSYGCCTWLRSGREALHLVALNVRGDKQSPVVLMPAYCCHSMVDPFEKAGWKIIYYRLNDDLTVDLDYLKQLLVSCPAAVLTMNYFGSASTLDAVVLVKDNCPECICVEDFSHCTFSLGTIYNPKVDYYVSSIRKSIGVCDGAVIISHNALDKPVVEDNVTGFVEARREAQRMKSDYSYSKDSDLKNLFLLRLRQQEEELDKFSGVHCISEFGRLMLGAVNGGEIRNARQINMKHMLDLLASKVESVPGIDRCVEGAPFSFPVLVENRDVVQKRLAESGVYAPVLWPISDDARAICSVSARMADMMLSIPVDQRYDYDDIEDIARIVKEICC